MTERKEVEKESYRIEKIRIAMIAGIVLTFLLFGQMTFQVYATITPTTVSTTMHFNDDWNGRVGKLLQIQTNFTMQRTDTLQYGTLFTRLNASGWISVNGKKIGFRFWTTKYPTAKIYGVLDKKVETTSSSPVRYGWDGITFISVDSRPLHVEYDHPDNGPYESPSYDVPPNEADPTTLQGYGRYHHHIPVWRIEDMIAGGTLMSLAGAIAALIGVLLAIPELISDIIALFLSVVAGVLAVLGLVVRVFTESVLRTELGDGWTWIWGLGSWWIFFWWIQSFGRWRDWPWLFAIIGGGGGRIEMGKMVPALYKW